MALHPAPKRRTRPHTENADFLAFARRILAAMGKRAAADIDSLGELAELAGELDAQLVRAVRRAREDDGYSWAEIGARLGVSRQAAQQRFGRAIAAVD